MQAERNVIKLNIRVDFGQGQQIGPGKIALLEHIGELGSMAKAAKAMGMSYRRAWLLVQDVNGCFAEPCVISQTGGTRGGGAQLTPMGKKLVKNYRAMEAKSRQWAKLKFRASNPKIKKSPARG